MFTTQLQSLFARFRSSANVSKCNKSALPLQLEPMEARLLLSAVVFATPANYTTKLGPQVVVTADFNGDGKLDLATINNSSSDDPGTVSLLQGNGNGTFKAATSVATGAGPTAMVTGDFNGDGKIDLAVANYTDATVGIYLGKGDGTFQTPKTLVTSLEPQSLAAADFNGDGKSDLVVGSMDAGKVTLYLSNGDGTFASQANYYVNSPVAIAVADLNGDSKLDLAVVDQSDNVVRILLLDSNYASTVHLNTVGDGPDAIATGDFNGDGHLDLAITCYNDSALNILRGSGTGTFGLLAPVPTGLDPEALVVGDFNLDGKSDVATANWGDNAVGMLTGNGTGGFAATYDVADDLSGPSSLALGDFNVDGMSDLATANNQGSNASVMLRAGNHAPVLTASGLSLLTINQGDTTNQGMRIPDLLVNATITDADAGALKGIAITATDNANGTWQYSTNGGTTWTTFKGYNTAARLLTSLSTNRIRFVPNSTYFGTISAAITFRAWDQVYGVNGGTLNATYGGIASCLSLAKATASITVKHVNHAPVLDNTGTMKLNKIVVGQNNPGTKVSDIIASAGGNRITDADSGAYEGIAVVATDTSHGTWQYSLTGSVWLTLKGYYSAARLLATSAYIRFVPAAGYTGTVSPALTFFAWDQTWGTNGGSLDATTRGGTTSLSTASETASVLVSLT